MGQSHGKFSVPQSAAVNKGHKSAVEEGIEDIKHAEEVSNGEVVNGNVQLTDIPPITEPAEESGDAAVPVQQNGGHDTLIKKCKKRAASWKAKTFNFKKEVVEPNTTQTTTDENNNLEEEQQPASEEPVSTTTPVKVKKSKTSFRNLMKRASSNLSKKEKKDKEVADSGVEATPASSDVVVQEETKAVEPEVTEEKKETPLPSGELPAVDQIVQEVMEAVQKPTEEAVETPLSNGIHTEQESANPEEAITDKMASLKVDETEQVVESSQ